MPTWPSATQQSQSQGPGKRQSRLVSVTRGERNCGVWKLSFSDQVFVFNFFLLVIVLTANIFFLKKHKIYIFCNFSPLENLKCSRIACLSQTAEKARKVGQKCAGNAQANKLGSNLIGQTSKYGTKPSDQNCKRKKKMQQTCNLWLESTRKHHHQLDGLLSFPSDVLLSECYHLFTKKYVYLLVSKIAERSPKRTEWLFCAEFDVKRKKNQ